MHRQFSICAIILLLSSLFPLNICAAPPAGFPDKSLLSSNPKSFWLKFGEAVNKATPGLSAVDKGKKIVAAIGKHYAHYGFEANTGGFGRVVAMGASQTCGDWTQNRLQVAFKGAGINHDSILSVESEITSVAGYVYPGPANRVHQAAALKDQNGDIVVFDVWQQGYDNSTTGLVYGSVKGVGKSKYNGMSMKDWVALQKSYYRSKITINEGLAERYAGYLAGAAARIIKKHCDPISSQEIKRYALKLVNDKWRFDPYFLVQSMINDGKLNCRDFEITSSVLLLLDTSGSMSGKKMAAAKQAAVSAIQNMPKNVEVGLMTYSGGCKGNFPFFPFTRDTAKLTRAIKKIKAGGGTPMTPALQSAEKAIRGFGHGKTGKIILLCDGQNSCSANPVKAADSIFRRNIPVNRNQSLDSLAYSDDLYISKDPANNESTTQAIPAGDEFYRIDFNASIFDELLNRPAYEMKAIKIFTVGLQVNSSQQNVLDKVAKAGGGKAVSAKDVKDLTDAFEEVIKKKPEPKPEPQPEPEPEPQPKPEPKRPSGWINLNDL